MSNIISLHSLSQLSNNNHELRADNYGNLKEKINDAKSSLREMPNFKTDTRQTHRNQAIESVKVKLQQEYGLSDNDASALMASIDKKGKITVGDVKNLIDKSNAINSTFKIMVEKQKDEIKQEVTQLHDLKLVWPTKVKEDTEKAISGRNKRDAEVTIIGQQVRQTKGTHRLLETASVNLSHLGSATYGDLRKACKEADLGIDKLFTIMPKDLAKQEGQKWPSLSKDQRKEFTDRVKNSQLDKKFVSDLAQELMSSPDYFKKVQNLNAIGLQDAQLWDQNTLVEGKILNSNGMCYGLVTFLAIQASQGNFNSPSEFLSTLNKDNYEQIQELQNSQRSNTKFGSIIEDMLEKTGQRSGVKIDQGFNEIALRQQGASGHAIAVYAQYDKVTFFDPNFGMFEFDSSEKAENFVNDFVNANYAQMTHRVTTNFKV